MDSKYITKSIKFIIETDPPLEVSEQILIEVNEIMNSSYNKPSTAESLRSRFVRTPIARKFGKDSEIYKLATKIIRFNKAGKEELKETINKRLILTEETYANKAKLFIKNHKNSDDMIERLLSMMLSSGSKLEELLFYSTFLTSAEGWILQNGVKTKLNITEIDKPLIDYEPSKFIKDVDLVRMYLGTNHEMDKIPASLSKEIAIIFKKKLFHDKTINFARKLYCSLSHDKTSGLSISEWKLLN